MTVAPAKSTARSDLLIASAVATSAPARNALRSG